MIRHQRLNLFENGVEKVWLKQYPEGVAAEVDVTWYAPLPKTNVGKILCRLVREPAAA